MKTCKSIVKVIFIALLMVSTEYVFSQTTNVIVIDSTSKEPSNWKFGMGFGMNFVGGTNLSISPNLTYNVSDKVAFGGGLQWNYSAIKDLRTTSTIGGNLSTFYYPSKKIMTLLEFQELNVSTKVETEAGEVKDSSWESVLFIGAGVNITNKITVGLKYNMLYTDGESVYTSAIIPFVNISF